MNLAELESKRGYVAGCADRLRVKLGLKIPDEWERVALIQRNMEKKFMIGRCELAVQNFNPQPKQKQLGKKGAK